jgi:hypothetical protein
LPESGNKVKSDSYLKTNFCFRQINIKSAFCGGSKSVFSSETANFTFVYFYFTEDIQSGNQTTPFESNRTT